MVFCQSFFFGFFLIENIYNRLFREYESRNEPAQKIKEEVEYHLAQQKILEQSLPPNIGIGPFHILTESVRQGLSKKRKALANSMLELLARRLRKQAEDACEEFKGERRFDVSFLSIIREIFSWDYYRENTTKCTYKAEFRICRVYLVTGLDRKSVV